MRRSLLVAVTAFLAASLSGCRAAAPSAQPAAAEVSLSSGGACGICLAHSYQAQGSRGYGTAASAETFERIRALGVRSVSLTPFGYQTLTGTTIRSSEGLPGGETTDAMRVEVERCAAEEITVMVKPHLWVTSGWRGELAPAEHSGGWDAWFEAYTEFIVEWARFSENVGADWFVVGVELKSSSAQTDRWREVIRRVREVYDGRLTYAANWDEVEQIEFWGDLDAIGVQMFAPLAIEGVDPTLDSTRQHAQSWLDRYRTVATAAERPIILTEAGVINRADALLRPYEWPNDPSEEPTVRGDQHQEWAYRALIDTFGAADDVLEIYWWKVLTDPNTQEEGPVGFSPLGKPAAEVVSDACRGG